MTASQTPPTGTGQTPPLSDLSDLSGIETIYTAKIIDTLQIRLSPKYLSRSNERLYIHSPDAAYQVLKGIYATLDQDQEHFVLLALNSVNEFRCYKVVASGGHYVVSDVVYPQLILRLIFRTALFMGASRLVVAHNHPSEWLVPSDDDLMLTQTLVVAGQLLDIEVYDHIIYGEEGYTSIRECQPKIFEGADLDR